jgi:hypothetical protein
MRIDSAYYRTVLAIMVWNNLELRIPNFGLIRRNKTTRKLLILSKIKPLLKLSSHCLSMAVNPRLGLGRYKRSHPLVQNL